MQDERLWDGGGGPATYTTVGTVSPPALLGGLVDLDVLDDQVAGIETLGIGVGLGVLEETEQVLSGLDGPASLGDTESLACTFTVSFDPLKSLTSRLIAIPSFPSFPSKL